MQSKPKRELVRLVCGEGGLMLDPTGKADGRGVYLCPSMECFDRAAKRKAIERSLGVSGISGENKELLMQEFKKRLSDTEVAE